MRDPHLPIHREVSEVDGSPNLDNTKCGQLRRPAIISNRDNQPDNAAESSATAELGCGTNMAARSRAIECAHRWEEKRETFQMSLTIHFMLDVKRAIAPMNPRSASLQNYSSIAHIVSIIYTQLELQWSIASREIYKKKAVSRKKEHPVNIPPFGH